MKCLVIGSGGREHAMAWRLAQAPGMQRVWVAPGNAGTACEPGLENIPIQELHALADFAERERPDFTVVGPEAPLAAGLVDVFRARGLPVFGPVQAAAQLESSKDFAKAFMARHGIPTAAYRTFTDADEAHAWVRAHPGRLVVKADGLAAGKGVVVAEDAAEVHAAIDHMLRDNHLGGAGARVVIEEFLEGEEASFIVMVDGEHILPLSTSQDHKRLADADRGPNTGGMGAYSPAPVVTPAVFEQAMREIIEPAVRGMAAEGHPYTGFLYAGLMIGPDGTARTLEFNCRLGDPETQALMARLDDNFAALIQAAIAGRLHEVQAHWDPRPALCVVLAAPGYPQAPRTGAPITGCPTAGNPPGGPMVFHAGTQPARPEQADAHLPRTSGGRVLGVTALGTTLAEARAAAYATVEGIHFEGMQFRRDIGHRAL